jgi:hypothetical protein
MTTIREENGIAIFQIGERFYVVGCDRQRGQVTSVLASDAPRDGGSWFSGITEKGVQYVGHGSSRAAAMAAFRRVSRA